nr:MAG TPA: hypothetical protein [Caudoviricetes sp.]
MIKFTLKNISFMADVHSIFKVSAVHIINKRTTCTTTFTKLRSSYISFIPENILNSICFFLFVLFHSNTVLGATFFIQRPSER